MSEICNYIQRQQAAASHLVAVMRAIEAMHRLAIEPEIQGELIGAARAMAELIDNSLDIVNLPEGGAA